MSECSNFDVIENLIEDGSATGTDWHIINNNGAFKILNNCSGEALFSILENGYIGLGEYYTSNVIGNYSNVNFVENFTNFIDNDIINTSNYVLYRTNILELTATSNNINISNYVRSTSNTLVNYNNLTNKLVQGNGILIQEGTNIISTIQNWTNISSNDIYYNSFGNVGIGVTPASKLHIYDEKNENAKLIVQNNIINSLDIDTQPQVPSIQIPGVIDKYLKFTYTTDTYGLLGQTQYTFTIPDNVLCDILIIGGGGAGGYSLFGGGGGAGGYVYLANVTLSPDTYIINVGKGGSAIIGNGENGYNSSLENSANVITALGGGGGAGGSAGGSVQNGRGSDGGSGGGGSVNNLLGLSVYTSGGNSTQNSIYGYGNGGNGNGFLSTSNIGGGGGGASGAALSGTGANGFENSITGVPLYYAGGGGAGTSNETLYNGGLGGGGRGGNIFGFLAISGTNGYGGGGGGGGGDEGGLGEEGEGFGGDGGSGVVVIRYKRTVSHVATFSSSIELTRGVIDDSNTDYKIGNYNGDFKIISSTSGINTDALVINQNGNVGIGTITPASKLYLYDDITNATKLTLHNNFTASNAITSSSIELIRGTSNDNNPDYKIGNYEGDFKIISSTSGINTDALVINQNGNITIGGNVAVGNVTATSFFGNGNGISGVLLTSNDTNLSNYVLSTSNILVNRTRTEESFGSNYVGRLNTNASNYILSTSNILVDRIRAEVGFGSNYVGRLNANASNYVISTSNILVDRIRAEVGFGSNYVGRLNTNASNYVLLTSNILANRIVTEIGFGSNYVGRLDANISNYVLSTSNILVERIVTEVSFGSNYVGCLDANISNYVLSTNDSLVERIVTEVGFGSNYSTRLDASASNNVLLTSNILVNRIRTEVGFGSNYSAMLDANISNYVVSTNDSLANRITNLVTDDITETINSENKFIVNDRYNNNLLVNGTLTINSNLVVLGESTRLETIVYTTERLEVINENTTSVALKIQQKDIYTDIFNASNSNAIVFTIANNGDVNISGTYKKNNRDILNDTSNYVVSTSNILVNRIKSEDVFGSNYSRRLDSNISNYVVSTSNILVNRIKSEDIFGSNYSRILDSNVSNYVSLTSNILINIIDSVSSKWTISETGIYNNTANVGIGTSSPSNKLHIYNDTSNAIKLTIQNNIPPNIITSTPAATTTGYTNNYIYMVFTYTTDTEQFSGATQYTINVPTGGKTCDILMVGGGGAGGKEAGAGGGGGAVLYGTNINIPAGVYLLKVGKGAIPGESSGKSTQGFGATILGGGSAGNYSFGGPTIANNGGSGSGHKVYSDYGVGGVDISSKGTILTDAIVYNGNIGSFGQFPPAGGIYGGGGGGAGSAGKESGDGGDGVLVNITGTNYYWGGGGGGGSAFNTAKNGGLGGGGAGIDYQNYGNIYGTVDENFSYTIPIFMNGGQHTGGGGGGGGYANNTAGEGGSGIIILRYLESTSTSIELLRGNITDYNTDYKIGNYEGDFKIISSTSGINTDALVINQNGNLKVGGNVVVGNVTATSFFGNGNGISGVLLTSNDTNISNYVLSTSNTLVDRTRAEVGFGSNYVGRLDANLSNYVISTSNILVDRTMTEVGFGSNYVGRLDANISNYVISTSNILVDRTRAEVGFGSNYIGRLDTNISNYILSTSNTLVDRTMTEVGFGSNHVGRLDANISNYVLSTSNTLVDRTRTEVGFGSNYVGRLDANLSNYVISTSNILVDRTRTEVGFGSNYVGRLDANLSNYVISTSNTLVDRTRTEVGFGSNYVGRLDANLSNYVLSTSNILVNRIGTGGGGGSSQWTTTGAGIYYNSNVVVGGSVNATSFIGDGSRLSGVLVTSNNTNLSNYILSSSNILVDRIRTEVDFGSNYIVSTSNILVDRTMTEVGFGSNYVGRLDANLSNYILSSSNILVDRIRTEVDFGSNYIVSTSNILVNRIGTSSQWTTLNNNIYYNTSNVGIGTNIPNNKLHIYNNLTNDTSLLLQNEYINIPAIIEPSAILINSLDSGYKYFVFNYTIDNVPLNEDGDETPGITEYTFTLLEPLISAQVLIVGGGAAGGSLFGAGGGGGDVFFSTINIPAGVHNIRVGIGGVNVETEGTGDNGKYSSLILQDGTTYKYGGGGYGGNYYDGSSSGNTNNPGGGGGGAEGGIINEAHLGSSDYLNRSGAGGNGTYLGGAGGGGGAIGRGGDGSQTNSGNGGQGMTIFFPESTVSSSYGGGGGGFGGGGGWEGGLSPPLIIAGAGIDGGGNGATNTTFAGNGINGRGGGGGGGSYSQNGLLLSKGGNGGHGVVIIKFNTSLINSEGNATIELVCGNKNDNNTDYKIGNYNGNFKIISSTSGINTDALVINQSSNVAVGGSISATSFIGDGSRLSGVLVTSNNTNVSNYVLSTSNILVNRISSSSQWTTSNNSIYYNSNVGIGTNTPASKLHLYDNTPNTTTLYVQNEFTADINPTPAANVSGIITGSTDKFMIFTQTGTDYTFTIPTRGVNCDILMIGGGGGGWDGGGGAGACIVAINQTLPAGSYVVNVGIGGVNSSTKGDDSYIQVNGTDRYRAKGGGNSIFTQNTEGSPGGCGGGASSGTPKSGGATVNTNVVTLPDGSTTTTLPTITSTYAVMGNPGGNNGVDGSGEGGGGGIGTAGENAGNGGNGAYQVTLTGSSNPINFRNYFANGRTSFGVNDGNGNYYIGGGGSGWKSGYGSFGGGLGGGGGNNTGSTGVANTGSGSIRGWPAGSGIIIIRYRTSSSSSIELIQGYVNDSNTDYKIGNYNCDFKIISSTAGINTDRLIINQNGNLGIGTTTSTSKLYLYDDITNATILTLHNNMPANAITSSSIELIRGTNNDSNTDYKLGNYNGDFTIKSSVLGVETNRLSIINSGNVGIGTTNPGFLLEVATGTGTTLTTSYTYFKISTALLSSSTAITDICSKFNSSIWTANGGSVIASSDSRIKEDIQDINDDGALQSILAIEPKTYKYIDKVIKGNKKVYGFIAQQIREVIPEATSLQKSYIPNIMLLADYNNHIITLPSQPIYIIKHNDKIKCYDKDDKEIFVEVVEVVDGLTFKIKEPEKEYTDTKIFVYGTHIDDFHTLDKNYIYTLNVCATQELHRRIEAQNITIKAQEERIKELETKMVLVLNHVSI
jgi:hypothetical protein